MELSAYKKDASKVPGCALTLKIYLYQKEIGYDKPGKAYFDYCLFKNIELHRENTVIIGDSLTSDIQGAKTPASGPSGIILIRVRILQKFSRITRLMSFQRLKTYWKKFSFALMFYGIENKI